jgi:hypothetical protein
LKIGDAYKPYYEAPEELLRPEVDHIEAISALGTNTLSNLQVLCRLCNAGKGRGLGLNLRDEVRYAGTPIGEISRAHRCSLVYYVIRRDGQRCTRCDGTLDELTIRPIVDSGAIVRSNLRTVCTACIRH